MNFIFGDAFRVFKIFFKKVFVIFSHSFDKFATEFFDFILHIIWDINNIECCTHIFFMPDDGTIFYKINTAFKVIFIAYWQYDRHCIGFEHFSNLRTNIEKIGSLTIHFIDKAHSWNFIVVSQSPVGFRLWLNTINC